MLRDIPDKKGTFSTFGQMIRFLFAVILSNCQITGVVNCLVADGKKFAHPLHHLGKSESDLPVIAIDSFRHMYVFSGFNDLK